MEMFGVQLLDAGASADLVTDAYIAAAAISLGATVVTFDRDFRRFDGLSVLRARLTLPAQRYCVLIIASNTRSGISRRASTIEPAPLPTG